MSVLKFMVETFVLRKYQFQLFRIRSSFFLISNVHAAGMSAIPLSRLNLEWSRNPVTI